MALVLVALVGAYTSLPTPKARAALNPVTILEYFRFSMWPWILASSAVLALNGSALVSVKTRRFGLAWRLALTTLAAAGLLLALSVWLGLTLEFTDQNL